MTDSCNAVIGKDTEQIPTYQIPPNVLAVARQIRVTANPQRLLKQLCLGIAKSGVQNVDDGQ